jgi:integrase
VVRAIERRITTGAVFVSMRVGTSPVKPARRRSRRSRTVIGEEYKDQGLIFATATGGIIQAENLPHRTFRQLLRAAGLPAIRLYDPRHSHATLLMADGVTREQFPSLG